MSARQRPMAGFESIDEEKCRSIDSAMDLIGRKWTSSVLLAGVRGARRFVEYRALVSGISDRLLSARLRELEEAGMIERTVVPTTPVQITYRPTEHGAGLVRALQPLVDWSLQHRV